MEGYSWHMLGITFRFYPNYHGMFSWPIPYIKVLSLLGLLVVIFFWWKTGSLGLWMVLLGGISNVFDRLMFGYVVDFIRVKYLPVVGGTYFNFADVLVDLGMVMLLWEVFARSK